MTGVTWMCLFNHSRAMRWNVTGSPLQKNRCTGSSFDDAAVALAFLCTAPLV